MLLKVSLAISAALIFAVLLGAQQGNRDTQTRQGLDEAWWTGSLLAPSASTLPRGHFLFEPYLYDVIVEGAFDSKGTRRQAPHSDGFASLTYLTYGLRDRLNVGLISTFGYNRPGNGPSSSGIGMGDLTVQTQYRLWRFHEGRRVPTISVNVQQSFPTGRYDRLGNRPSDGFGTGAFATSLGIYAQTYFWVPNGRLLRMRFDLAQTFPKQTTVTDASVYGTQAGFRGVAEPGKTVNLNASWEYSVTRSWVLALDAAYRHGGNTHVVGSSVNDSAKRIPCDPAGLRHERSIRVGPSRRVQLGPKDRLPVWCPHHPNGPQRVSIDYSRRRDQLRALS